MPAFHRIIINVPVPDGSIAMQQPVMAKYQDRLTALYEGLPEGATYSDYISKERAESPKRKTADERFAAMAKERGIELGPDGKPVVPAAEGQQSRRPQHQAAAQ